MDPGPLLTPPPFTLVNKHTLTRLLPSILSTLSKAKFIAIDTEFTGLGSSPKTRAA
ncbi:hypothetical protein HDV05_007132, partial [Chytridiales sp. JEL 0842]